VTAFVLDASVALSWCFEDEATAAAWAALDRLESDDAAVPALWSLEMANILAAAERRGRLSAARISEFIALLEGLAIEVDDETARHALHETLTLARNEGLTAYDASYLELAMRLGVPLATKDAQLARVAAKLGVAVLEM
jgi:predicted nucleic acid-binding protein